MNKETNRKGIMVAMGILLIANIILLAFFLFNSSGSKKPDRKSPMTTYLQNEIGFTKEQMTEFDSVKADHRNQVKDLFDKMRVNKEEIFKELGSKGFSDSAITDAATYSAMQQKELELSMLKHLKIIRDICTPEQKAKFDTGFYKIMSRGRDPQINHKQ
ncbi:MAG: Spy/CpxP family protein refolding chaperone [Ferruginibacter sp.]